MTAVRQSRVERAVGDIACDLLEGLLLADRDEPEMLRSHAVGHDNLWNCDFHLVHEVAEMSSGGSRYYLLSDPREQAAIAWPIDEAYVVEKEDHWLFIRVTTVQPKDIRGLVKLVPPKCVAVTCGWLPKERAPETAPKWGAETTICGFLGGFWRDIGLEMLSGRQGGIDGGTNQIMRTRAKDDEVNGTITIALSAALTNRYSWHAALGFAENGPRIIVPTSPDGCLTLFKSRLAAPGEKRRAALRHWVNSHYRDQPNSSSDLTYVREHLRGNTRFLWNNLDCELMVSAFDLEKNEAFASQAAEWRSRRKHNHVRLKVKWK